MVFKFKLGFFTDLHGSEYSFKRSLNIAKSKRVDFLIISGGLIAKEILFVEDIGGRYFLNGKKVNLNNLNEDALRSGKYIVVDKKEVIEDIKSDKSKLEKIVIEKASEQMSRWVKIAEEIFRLEKVFWSPAHGDIPQLDSILKNYGSNLINENVINLEEIQIVSLGFGSPIGNSYREIPDSELYIKGKSLLKDADKERLIMNFHMPPLNTKLDNAKVGLRKSHVGSKAVLDLITEFQPIISLHGHVHESTSMDKVGETIAINPGSLYQLGDPSIVTFEVHKELKSFGSVNVSKYVIKNIEFVSTNPLDVI
ncbi:phosphoesterase [Saccharolobus solfataricus]|nr:phosphoesterase [Saccharolobus solfataricus]AKA74879.1 phosphoesterase [Saccharolobus solfataricus]AKA77575.1 phosphoesterase [Saccharolobus solfataricus]AKA80265.1 phosphoesterase [Saccharolobus solfataricus]AZF69344.1 phosphoesterase [Saccharolobus solfataricus]AZF71964.1 phosphoesterase [Saccharolobus solfataricus]